MLGIRADQFQFLADDEISRRIVLFLRDRAQGYVSRFAMRDLYALTNRLIARATEFHIHSEREITKFVLIGVIAGEDIFKQDGIVAYFLQSEGNELRVDPLLQRVIEDLPQYR